MTLSHAAVVGFAKEFGENLLALLKKQSQVYGDIFRYDRHVWPGAPVFEGVKTMQYVWERVALI